MKEETAGVSERFRSMDDWELSEYTHEFPVWQHHSITRGKKKLKEDRHSSLTSFLAAVIGFVRVGSWSSLLQGRLVSSIAMGRFIVGWESGSRWRSAQPLITPARKRLK